MRVVLADADARVVVPPAAAPLALHVTRAPRDGGWSAGRAGLLYRDLLPGRLGGRLIASHIRIERGGPVADYVHFHRVALQVIVVLRGTVDVVYEDAGAAFTMAPGDAVLQPPRIRHRVLRSSDALEVLEVAVPAVHETIADAELPLPNTRAPVEGREWSGQRFLRHVAASASWTRTESSSSSSGGDGGGVEVCDLGIAAASRGAATVRALRGTGAVRGVAPAAGATLIFVTDGAATLRSGAPGEVETLLAAGDAATPAAGAWQLTLSDGASVLDVTLPSL